MPSPTQALLVAELKRSLKEQNLTYAAVAKALKLSLASVKRLFSSGELSLDRLDRICELLGFGFADLVDRAREREAPTSALTHAQEQQIVADPKLLLVTWLVLNGATVEAIVRHYTLTEREVVRHLIQLDRLKVLELQPGNRVRLLVSRHFSWRPGGPVQRYIYERLLKDFFESTFSAPDEEFYFHGGHLTASKVLELKRTLRNAARECAELVDQERGPARERRGAAFVIALRPWSYSGFRDFERASESK